MSNIAKFLRADGVEMVTVVGSPSFDLMVKDGSFTRVYSHADSLRHLEPDGSAKQAMPDLAVMKKADLLAFAAAQGIEVNPKLKNTDIIAVIEAALVEAEGEGDGAEQLDG